MINTSLISLIVALAMVFSGGYVAEDPNAYSARSLRISDVVVTIEGTEYPLDLEAVLGVATENGSMLLDVGLIDGDSVLFPVQAALGYDGLSFMLNDEGNAYLLTTDYLYSSMGLNELPDEVYEIVGAYIDLLTSAAQLQSINPADEALTAQLEAVIAEFFGDVSTEAVTIDFEGETLNAERRAYNLDSAQMPALVDAVYAVIAPDYIDAYCRVFNQLFALTGTEPAMEITGFGDMMRASGVQMTADIVETLAEDGRGYADVTLNMNVDVGEDFPIGLSIPMEVVCYDADTAKITVNTDLEIEGETVHLEILSNVDGGYMDMQMDMDDTSGFGVSAFMKTNLDESGAADSLLLWTMGDSSTGVSVEVESSADAEGNGNTRFVVDVAGLYGVSLNATVSSEPIENRIASAETVTVSDDAEMESASTGIAMSALGLMSDTERLMSNESLIALIAAVEALVPEEDLVFEEYTEDAPAADDWETDDVEGSVEDLSFPLPEFTWLPEGYELTETFVYSDYDSANLYYEYTGESDEYFSTLYVDLNTSFAESTRYTLGADGMTAVTVPVITVEREPDAVYIQTVIDGVEINISYYDPLSDDDIFRLVSGIVFEAASAETTEAAPEKQVIAD